MIVNVIFSVSKLPTLKVFFICFYFLPISACLFVCFRVCRYKIVHNFLGNYSGTRFFYQRLQCLKALLDGKFLAKLFSKVTKNNLIYLIVYRVFYRKLNQRLLKEGKE